jgi:hypothetical protein
MFIPLYGLPLNILNNQNQELRKITTLSPTKCTTFFPDILHHNIPLINPTCFDPSQDHRQGFTFSFFWGGALKDNGAGEETSTLVFA